MKMALLQTAALACGLLVFVVPNNEAAAPFFLQAISSALGTIPFTAGPMTTGLVGAKLAVGSKLLYNLGFFGRRRSKPKSPPKRASPQTKMNIGGPAGGMQNMPPFGGFPQQFGGFNQPNFQSPFLQGYDHSQMYQMLLAQGIDPATAMQAMSFNGGAGGQGMPPMGFGGGQGMPPMGFGGGQGMPPMGFGGGQGMPPMGFGGGGSQGIPASQFPFPTGTPVAGGSGNFPNDLQSSQPNENSQDEGSEDVESFFTFLRDMDDNTCISRLMCDIGANPSFLGEFSENIHGIISSLDVLPSSGAFQYIAIMEAGRREGGCGKRFPQCGDAAYEVVKNVAPSVGVPQNINSDIVNKL